MKIATTILAFCVAALLALGTVMLYSSPKGSGLAPRATGGLLTQQLMWGAIGLAACAGAAWFDYRKLKKFAVPLLAVCVVLLGLVFVPGIGHRAGGASRWLNLRVMNFQPSELAKLAIIITIAFYADYYHRQMPRFKRGMLYPAAFILPVLALIFAEPDYGTTILLASVSGVMLIVAGVRWHIIALAGLIGLAAIGTAVMTNEVRRARVIAFLHPELHREGKGFQQWQSTIALGSGGPSGVGLGDGRQKFGYVPENHTDFIFSIIGEELGLAATLGVVAAFVAIALCGVFIAANAADRFGSLLAIGITFLIALQAVINIGVVTTLLPNKGLALPFVSYGGSSLVTMLTCVGVLFSVVRHAKEPIREIPHLNPFNPFNPGETPSTQIH